MSVSSFERGKGSLFDAAPSGLLAAALYLKVKTAVKLERMPIQEVMEETRFLSVCPFEAFGEMCLLTPCSSLS